MSPLAQRAHSNVVQDVLWFVVTPVVRVVREARQDTRGGGDQAIVIETVSTSVVREICCSE